MTSRSAGTSGFATCLSRCHRGWVSNSWHFSARSPQPGCDPQVSVSSQADGLGVESPTCGVSRPLGAPHPATRVGAGDHGAIVRPGLDGFDLARLTEDVLMELALDRHVGWWAAGGRLAAW